MADKRNDNGKRKNSFLYREVPSVYDKAFGTFDIETYGLGGAYADGTTCAPGIIRPEIEGVDKDGKPKQTGRLVMADVKPVRHRTVEELFDALMNPYRGVTVSGGNSERGFTWYAHNGANYDFCYIIKMLHDVAVERGFLVHTTMQGPKLIGMSFKECGCHPRERSDCRCSGKISIVDTFPNLQMKLEDAAKIYAPQMQKLKGEIDFEGGEIYDPENERHVAYMLRDSEALWWTWRGFCKKTYEAFGVMPGMSAGGTAMKAWKATIPEGHVYYRASPSTEEWLENFKVGAIVWPGSTSKKQVDMVTIDRTAAFAGAMLEGGFPTCKPVEVDEYEGPDVLGYYKVKVHVPDDMMVFPMFPYQGKWPTGDFETFATNRHLEWAKKFGVTFEVIEGLVYDRTEDIFTELMLRCEAAEYPSDGSVIDAATKAPYKNVRNSLNGRFAMGRSGKEIVIGPDLIDEDEDDLNREMEIVIDPETRNVMPYHVKTVERDAPYIHPEWYALVVERQRREMIDLLMMLEPHERGKVDTDSITLPKKSLHKLTDNGRVVLGPGYGNYKIEHDWAWIVQIGPKNYFGFDRTIDKDTGLPVGEQRACKGMPKKLVDKNPEIQHLAAEGNAPLVEIESTYKPLDVLRQGLDTPARKINRRLGTSHTVKGWVLKEDGSFVPPKITEEDNA